MFISEFLLFQAQAYIAPVLQDSTNTIESVTFFLPPTRGITSLGVKMCEIESGPSSAARRGRSGDRRRA